MDNVLAMDTTSQCWSSPEDTTFWSSAHSRRCVALGRHGGPCLEPVYHSKTWCKTHAKRGVKRYLSYKRLEARLQAQLGANTMRAIHWGRVSRLDVEAFTAARLQELLFSMTQILGQRQGCADLFYAATDEIDVPILRAHERVIEGYKTTCQVIEAVLASKDCNEASPRKSPPGPRPQLPGPVDQNGNGYHVFDADSNDGSNDDSDEDTEDDTSHHHSAESTDSVTPMLRRSQGQHAKALRRQQDEELCRVLGQMEREAAGIVREAEAFCRDVAPWIELLRKAKEYQKLMALPDEQKWSRIIAQDPLADPAKYFMSRTASLSAGSGRPASDDRQPNEDSGRPASGGDPQPNEGIEVQVALWPFQAICATITCPQYYQRPVVLFLAEPVRQALSESSAFMAACLQQTKHTTVSLARDLYLCWLDRSAWDGNHNPSPWSQAVHGIVEPALFRAAGTLAIELETARGGGPLEPASRSSCVEPIGPDNASSATKAVMHLLMRVVLWRSAVLVRTANFDSPVWAQDAAGNDLPLSDEALDAGRRYMGRVHAASMGVLMDVIAEARCRRAPLDSLSLPSNHVQLLLDRMSQTNADATGKRSTHTQADTTDNS